MKKPSRPQLRGAALQRRIETVIRELADASTKAGQPYTYNATHVAKQVPTTRKTLRGHDVLVERVLDDLNARRRMVDGNATIEHLREHIEHLKDKIEEHKKVVLSLRSHHVDIYERLYSHSVEAAHLISPIIGDESREAGRCILCNLEKTTPETKTNVVALTDKKNG